MVDGPPVRFARVRLATGPRLHYAECGRPDGEPVLFLHGWPDSWFSFSRLLPSLTPTLRAIVVDQRGFGDSERSDGSYAIPELAADAIALLDELEIARATLVGHSFGSFVARHAAIADPLRVRALALIGTGFSSSNEITRSLQDGLRRLTDPITVEFARDFQGSTAYRPIPLDFFERIVTESMKLPAHLWRLTFDRLLEYDDAALLQSIAAPTLLLWGDRDALFSRSDQEQLLAAVPSARLIVYEETGHCPNWERPAQVATDLAGFVLQA